MNNMKKIFLGLVIACVCMLAIDSTTANACPMCKTATEDAGNSRQPQAYMASIITMLTVPSALFCVLGVSLYRISSKEQIIADQLNEQARQKPSVD
ncbi:MAG: hypothetical protein JKY95_17035 [Planctomycetaceae bacterium]|nr:hypothetical protein [Planctomycetaceae bacterium]